MTAQTDTAATPTSPAKPEEISSDERKRRELRKSKSVATGMLVVAAIVYAVSSVAISRGGPDWWGFVRTASEAGMVGGLADWFAVTALFRRPLGLPIPHTAIIPTKKDQMGASLGEFVGSNFLADDVVREKIRSLDAAKRAGTWVAQEENAERVTAELATVAHGMLKILRDDDVKAGLEALLRERLGTVQFGPPLGRLLEQVVADGAHHQLVEVLISRGRDWVVENRTLIMEIVTKQAPDWSPRFADEMVAARIHNELVRFVTAVHDNPSHQVRQSIDRMLRELSWDLRHSPEMQIKVDNAKNRVLDHPEVKAALGNIWNSAKVMLSEATETPDSELRRRVCAQIAEFGQRLATDEGLQAKTNQRIENIALHIVGNYRGELTAVITDTVARWDGQETAQKIELQVGRDLQFIRINGTVVGALAGLAIHTVTYILVG